MNLYTAALELAKLTGITKAGTATDGDIDRLIDENTEFPPGKFSGGTLWVLSGDNEGLCEVIIESANQTYTFGSTLASAIAAGDKYVVAIPKFTKDDLTQAINFVLGHTQILMVNESLSVGSQDEYDLPAGVKNVKRIFVAGNASQPYAWSENNSWREIPGKIVFNPGQQPGNTGRTIRLVYRTYHGELDPPGVEENELDESLNEEYVLWAAAEQLWRMRVNQVGKDDPLAIDFLNEAKSEKERELAAGKSINVDKAIRHSRF